LIDHKRREFACQIGGEDFFAARNKDLFEMGDVQIDPIC
jgi:hypothetical protein